MRCVDLVKDPQGQLLLRAFGGLRRLLFSLFHRRATWSVGRPGAAFSTPMSVALRWRLPRRRPPCPCCKFTSSTAISQQLNNNCVPNSRRVPPRGPSSWSFTLVQSCQPVFEQRLSAGIRVTSHHGILHDFHHQLLHPAPLMNSPSPSTCLHLLLVTSSHLDFGSVFSWGGPGNPRRRESLPRPHIGIRAQPPGLGTAPRPPSGVSHNFPFSADYSSPSLSV